MKKIDELWNILVESVPDLSGKKLCTPITGGLDSRTLAGVLRHCGYRIDFSYWVRVPDNMINQKHVEKLWDLLGVEQREIIDVNKLPRDFPLAIRILQEKISNLKEYSFLIPFHMDVYAGMKKSKSAERKYFYETWPQMSLSIYNVFGEIILPFENSRVIGYLLNLPRRDRLFENLYMRMIKKYLPDLADVPRCFEKNTGRPIPIKNVPLYILLRLSDRFYRRTKSLRIFRDFHLPTLRSRQMGTENP